MKTVGTSMAADEGNDLPPEFDPVYYRSLYSDLDAMDHAQAESHFIHYGQAEGRVASPLATREGFLKEIICHQRGDILEIGPFCSPVVRGSNVAYLDVLDATELLRRAKTLGIDSSHAPELIDFVGDLGAVDRQFAAVVSSHAIEHQTDLVYHLKSVSRLLEPWGRYYLIIPDKRYCFDAMIAASTIAEVLQAHKERRTRHTLRSVIEHRVLTTHNDASLHWQGAPVAIDQADQNRRLEEAMKEYNDAGEAYIDVHAWQFTPDSFRSITSSLLSLGLTDLRPLRVLHTPRNRPEFCAILEKVSK